MIFDKTWQYVVIIRQVVQHIDNKGVMIWKDVYKRSRSHPWGSFFYGFSAQKLGHTLFVCFPLARLVFVFLCAMQIKAADTTYPTHATQHNSRHLRQPLANQCNSMQLIAAHATLHNSDNIAIFSQFWFNFSQIWCQFWFWILQFMLGLDWKQRKIKMGFRFGIDSTGSRWSWRLSSD